MIGSNNFRGNQKLWLSRRFYCGTIVLMLLLLAGCAGNEPPTAAVLEPLAQKCAASHPILSMIAPIRLEFGQQGSNCPRRSRGRLAHSGSLPNRRRRLAAGTTDYHLAGQVNSGNHFPQD